MKLLSLLALSLVVASSPAALADDDASNAVLAKPGGDALIIWDASTNVAGIVRDKTADAAANANLERAAIGVLKPMVHLLAKNAKTVSVRVNYSETGAVSPVYGTMPFAGIETYATLTAPGAAITGNRAAWQQLSATAPIPKWFTFKISGKLPPR